MAMASRGPNTFKRTEIARLCRAVTDAGQTIDRVEVDTAGKMTVIVGGRLARPDDPKSSAPVPEVAA
jgi:hypothetical protein